MCSDNFSAVSRVVARAILRNKSCSTTRYGAGTSTCSLHIVSRELGNSYRDLAQFNSCEHNYALYENKSSSCKKPKLHH